MSTPQKIQKSAGTRPNLLSRWQDDIDRMERMFDSFFPMRRSARLADWEPSLATMTAPAIDVYEEGDVVVVQAEIPGAKKDEIEVNVTDSILTITGEKKREEEVRDQGYYRSERSYGSFSRSIELPAEVQTEKAEARFNDGVLEIRLRKTDDARKKAVKLKIS